MKGGLRAAFLLLIQLFKSLLLLLVNFVQTVLSHPALLDHIGTGYVANRIVSTLFGIPATCNTNKGNHDQDHSSHIYLLSLHFVTSLQVAFDVLLFFILSFVVELLTPTQSDFQLGKATVIKIEL